MSDSGPIHTPDQRLRVFVSSTMGELAAERRAVRVAVTRLRLVPVLFELGARPHPPRELYRAYLEQSQVFIGIYWQRYREPRLVAMLNEIKNDGGISYQHFGDATELRRLVGP